MASTALSSKIILTKPHLYQQSRLNSPVITNSPLFFPPKPNLSTNFNPKNPIFTVKKCSSMNGHVFKYLNEEEELQIEAKQTARNLIRSCTAVIELSTILRLPTLIAVAILSKIPVLKGKQAIVLLLILGLSLYWHVGFLWSILPKEKDYLLSSPKLFFQALVKPVQEVFDGERSVEIEIKSGEVLSIIIEEFVIVGFRVMKIVRGDIGEVSRMRKKHNWVDFVGFVFATATSIQQSAFSNQHSATSILSAYCKQTQPKL